MSEEPTKKPRSAPKSTRTRRAASKAAAPIDNATVPAPSGNGDGGPSRLSGQLDLLAGMAGTTSQIVTRAASILEEEIAAGINATQNIEERVIDVDRLRNADSQAVIQRFRKDAHDVVDILLDLVNVATNTMTDLSERAVKIGLGQPRGGSTGGGGRPSASAIPSLAVPTVAKAGESVEIPMRLENEGDKPIEAFSFYSSDLMNTNGEKISAQQISFSPDHLVIEPKQATTVTVVVQVPANAAPGTYSGLLQASRMDQLRAVLTLQIA